MLQEDDQYTYSYDLNGNLISKVDKVTSETTTYQYDGENKLIQVITPRNSIIYQYDGFGRRIAKTVNGIVTKYVYDQEDTLFELDENDQIKAIYTHGPGIDEPISVDRDTDGNGTLDTTYYYHYDGLGSVTAITDSTGNAVQTYEYDAFGKIIQQTGSVENSYTYTAREWDTETGLYFYRARYYDPTIGRFINADPIGFSGGDVNFYVYVQNNSVIWVDPSGLDVTVNLYPGAWHFGHVGVGINTQNTIGFYPDNGSNKFNTLTSRDVPGRMSADQRTVVESITIPTTPAQDLLMMNALINRINNPGNYNLRNRNCATTVNDVLQAGEINVPETNRPQQLMDDLRLLLINNLQNQEE